MRECPYSTKTREVFGNQSPPSSRFPSSFALGKPLRSRFGGALKQCDKYMFSQKELDTGVTHNHLNNCIEANYPSTFESNQCEQCEQLFTCSILQ